MVLSGQRDSVDSFIGWFLSSPLTCQRARILLEGSVRRGPSSAKVQDDIDAEDQVDGDVLRKTPLFSQLFLCLSRACLGKMVPNVLMNKWRKKWRFPHQPERPMVRVRKAIEANSQRDNDDRVEDGEH
jgi:hypothetical protein